MEKDKPAKLHVLTLTPFFPSAGDEVSGCFVAETLRQLRARGVASSVIAVDSIYHASRKPSKDSPADWIRYPQLPGNFGLSSAGTFLGELLLRRIRRLNRYSPIHVIHAHAALPCGAAAALLSRRTGIPFVVTIHGLDVFNSCFQQGIAAGWRRKASASVYESAKKVICISGRVQQLLTDGIDVPAASEVVYNGTDPGVFTPGRAQEQVPTILMVGNLLAGKGHELVLRALARLKHSHSGLQCRIIGEGADRDRFADLARSLGISDQVHFLGRRSRSEVAEAMRNCTVFALPSRYEGLGCVYLEAMASGKPVIACRGQGIDEIIQHGSNGWLIPVDGLKDLVQGLEALLANAALRERIGGAARQTILEKLTLTHQAQSLVKIYEKAAREPMTRPASISQERTPRTELVALGENDIAEVACFIAAQSGRSTETVESHLRWFLLENPARRLEDPLGFGLRSAGQLVGCILCSPQAFRFENEKILLMGSSSFYVDDRHRGHGGRIFLQYCRLGNQRPLFGTSANAEAAALWKAAGASPIPYSEGELFGVLRWPPVVEEFAHRQYLGRFLTRFASSSISNLAGLVRRLSINCDEPEALQPLTSAEQVADLPIHDSSAMLTAMRDLPYIRWRYFSGRDARVAAFAFRSRHPDREILVTVNQRTRGYRGQVNTLNVLDVYPEVSPDEWLRIVGALIVRYRNKIDAVVLRNQNSDRQKIFCERGFQPRAFQAPNGWFLDKGKLLPTRDWYPVPADGDGLI